MLQSIRLVTPLILLVGGLTACSSGGGGNSSPAGDGGSTPDPIPTGPPNILLIIADDMGIDAFAQYAVGPEAPFTPTLDALAAEGLIFDNLWVNPTCSPTRATILTGRYGLRTGVFVPGDDIGLEEQSLQSYLDENAPTPYSQALIGKWHLAGDTNGGVDNPAMMGISHFIGLLGGGTGDYFNWQRTENGVTSTSNTYITSELVDDSVTWINQQNAPWFLWLAFNAPHTPFHLPPSALHTRPLSGDQADIDANPREYFFAMIEAMDSEISRLINSLSPEDRANLIVLFIGDNGSPRQVAQDPPGAAHAKGSVYQGGIRTPMFVTGPGIRSGEREAALINGTDFFATVANLAGIDVPLINDSMSFADLLTDSNAPQRQDAYSESASAWAIRDTRYKLIQFHNGSQELYDLLNDPFEAVELISAGADVSLIIQSLEARAAEIR